MSLNVFGVSRLLCHLIDAFQLVDVRQTLPPLEAVSSQCEDNQLLKLS